MSFYLPVTPTVCTVVCVTQGQIKITKLKPELLKEIHFMGPQWRKQKTNHPPDTYSTEIRPTAPAIALLEVAHKVMDDLLVSMPSHGRQNHLGKTGKGSKTIEGWLTQLGSQVNSRVHPLPSTSAIKINPISFHHNWILVQLCHSSQLLLERGHVKS